MRKKAVAAVIALTAVAATMGGASASAKVLDTLNPPGTDLYEQAQGQDNTLLPGGHDGYAGRAVSPAGDVNGDGVVDYLVSAPSSDNNSRIDSGSVFVIYGEQGLTSLPSNVDLGTLSASKGYRIDGPPPPSDEILRNAPGQQFGSSVANAGDVNGDGVPDQLIGSPNASPSYLENAGQTQTGTVWIVYGRRTGLLQAPNGSAPRTNCLDLDPKSTSTFCRRAFFSNGATPGGYRIDGVNEQSDERFGSSVANAGDVNGDGVDDQIVGAEGVGTSRKGATWIIYGRRSGTLDPPPGTNATASVSLNLNRGLTLKMGVDGYRIGGLRLDSELGTSVANAGDVNGDEIPDQILAAPGAMSGAGTYVVVYGRRTGSSLPVAELIDLGMNGTMNSVDFSSSAGYFIHGEMPGDAGQGCVSATTVANAGDVNGDGTPDQLLGAPGASRFGRSHNGAVWVVYGRTGNGLLAPPNGSGNAVDLAGQDANSTAFGVGQGYRIDGPSMPAGTPCGIGVSVSGGESVDGNPVPDALIGSPFETGDQTRTNSGAVWLVSGRRSGYFGKLAPAGGANNIDLGATDGEINFVDTDGFKIIGPRIDAGIGSSVAWLSDLTGDNVSDVLLGAESDSPIPFERSGSSSILDPTIGITTQTCPDGTPIPRNGACGSVGDSCPDGKPLPANGVCDPPVERCPDGSPRPANGVCPGGGDNNCPDGSPRPANGVCPDNGSERCPDGSPKPANGVCPGGGNETCPDGKPRPANGVCTTSGGDNCPDGSPKPASGVCPGDGTTRCPDGSIKPASGKCPVGNNCVAGTPNCPDKPKVCDPASEARGDCKPGWTCPDGSAVTDAGYCDVDVVKLNALCKKLTSARVSQNVSKWAKFGRAARARIRGPKNGFFVYSDPRSATFSIFRYGVKLKNATFSVDGKAPKSVAGSRPRFVIKPKTLGPGQHKITAVIRPKKAKKNGKRLKAKVKVTLRFRVLPCPPAKMTVRQSKRKYRSGYDLRLGVDSGGPSLSQATIKLPFSIAAKALKAKRAKGRVIGKLTTGGKYKQSIKLKLPKKPRSSASLASATAGVKVVLKAGKKPTLVISGLRDGITKLQVLVKGRRNGLLVNRKSGKRKYAATLFDRGAPVGSVALSNTQKIYKKS